MSSIVSPLQAQVRPLRNSDRWVTAICLLVACGTHVPLIGEHLREAPYVGWLFIGLCAVSAVLAVLIVLDDSPAVWLLTGLVMIAAVVAFFWSRTLGLPQIHDDIGDWTEPLGFPAVTSEVLAAFLAWGAWRHRRSTVSESA